jgi:ribosome-binding protein aMBF1 (putative translation factor)
MNRQERKLAKAYCVGIAQWRRELGLTQLDLAKQIEVSASLVSAYERGAVLPDYPMRHKIDLALEDQAFRRAKSFRKRIGSHSFDKRGEGVR